MAKSKWEQVKDKLILVEGWARDGLTDEDIADKLGIAPSTFYDYKKKHSEFSESLKRGKEVIDYEVENALLKRALGYEYNEITQERYFDEEEKKSKMKATKIVTKQVAPDTTAQIYWLNNRKPKQWKNKRSGEVANNENLSKVEELLNKIKEEANK